MAGLTARRVRVLRLLGRMPSVSKIEARRASHRRSFERFQSIAASQEWKRYQTLAQYVASGEAEKERQRCEAEKAKFRNTEAYAKLQELKSLSKKRDIAWYLAQEQKGVFADLLHERELFFEDFTATDLDTKRWLPRFFWGDALLKKGYSFVGDPHCYPEDNNLEIAGSSLVIETRPDERTALAWDKVLGFVSERFAYSSGVVCTGQSFRMLGGRVEVKLRIRHQPGVYHALYLAGDSRTPQIDVFRTTTGKKVGLMSGVSRSEANALVPEDGVGALPAGSDYFLLRLDWEGHNLRWSINDVPYLSMEARGLDTPMYLVFASGVESGATPTGVAQMEIDWVRCTAYDA